MKLEIKDKKHNKLMHRDELMFAVSDTKITPARGEIRKQIAAQANAKEDMVIVDRLTTHFGTTNLSGRARIYTKDEDLKRMELKPIIARNRGKEEEKKPPAGAGAAPEAKKE